MSEYSKHLYKKEIIQSMDCNDASMAQGIAETASRYIASLPVGENEQFIVEIQGPTQDEQGDENYEIIVCLIQFYPPDVLIWLLQGGSGG